MSIEKEIKRLKYERNAVILAHNYQRPEVQDVADFVGDSLELSIKASETDASVIVFAGVRFMAETAKILSPEKKVLLPNPRAGCPMADMVTPQDVRELRKKYPDAAIVAYVNTTAEVKAEVDICCTSANAVKVVKKLPQKRIVFLPDKNLAYWVSTQVKNKEIIPYQGYCYVHNGFRLKDLLKAKKEHPDAEVLAHPEAPPEVVENADFVLSTSGMIRHAKKSRAKEFIIATEFGLTHRLKKENPGKEFYPMGAPRFCGNMKRTTIEDVYNSLLKLQHEIILSKEVIKKARNALEKMVEVV